MSEMDDWYDDDDDDGSLFGDDEVDLENMCVESGCFEDGRFGACGLCGGPLCFMHEEILCGFCSECTSSDQFSRLMEEKYRDAESIQVESRQSVDVSLSDEIPF